MKTKTFLIFISSVSLASSACFALGRNTKMGKPTQEELTMTTYTPDEEAEAVVLHSWRDVRYEMRAGGMQLVTHVQKRIKVLKEDGKRKGDVEIIIYNVEGGKRDVLSGLKGATYNLEDGKIIKSKLSADLKNEQRLNRYNVVKKFSMPNVVVGSILEYEYDIVSDIISFIEPWYAQEDIPVFFTEYDVEVPEWFTFRSDESGRFPLKHINTGTNFTAIVKGSTLSASATKDHFEGNELPRIKKDDYIYCLNDYCTKVIKDFTCYSIPGYIYKSYNQDWKEELMDLMTSDFGSLCKKNDPFDGKVIAQIQWPEGFSLKQKVDSLRNILWSKYSWNESYSMQAKDVRNLNREMSGNSSTLNFALLNMLNDAGLHAYPVVMSSRSNGRLPRIPNLRFLNAMTLYVESPSDSSYVYVDAASKDYPVGCIPSDMLVADAFVLYPETKQFTVKDLRKACKGSENKSTKIIIENEGLMTGQHTAYRRGLESAQFRRKYKRANNEEEFIQKIASDNDIEITDYQLKNLNNSQDAIVEIYSFSRQLDIEGDHIYVNPFIGFNRDSPFKDEKRDLPIEFSNVWTERQTIEIEIPEKYEVEELPHNLNLQMPDGNLSARISIKSIGQKVQIIYYLNLTTMFYDVMDYPALREFFNMLEQACNSKLVLKKKQ